MRSAGCYDNFLASLEPWPWIEHWQELLVFFGNLYSFHSKVRCYTQSDNKRKRLLCKDCRDFIKVDQFLSIITPNCSVVILFRTHNLWDVLLRMACVRICLMTMHLVVFGIDDGNGLFTLASFDCDTDYNTWTRIHMSAVFQLRGNNNEVLIWVRTCIKRKFLEDFTEKKHLTSVSVYL